GQRPCAVRAVRAAPAARCAAARAGPTSGAPRRFPVCDARAPRAACGRSPVRDRVALAEASTSSRSAPAWSWDPVTGYWLRPTPGGKPRPRSEGERSPTPGVTSADSSGAPLRDQQAGLRAIVEGLRWSAAPLDQAAPIELPE